MTTVTDFYDRAKEVQKFEDSKIGVKGLVDSGITNIPRFFVHPPETLSEISPSKIITKPDPDIIPIIDLSGADSKELRPKIVEKIARASREVGFFQIVNHGIGLDVMERLLGAIKGFHELPTEVKAKFYSRDYSGGVFYFSNIDIYNSRAATWRDTLVSKLSPNTPDLDEFPEICGKEALEWNEQMKHLGDLLMGLLCEGLGVPKGSMEKMTFGEGRRLVANYYPYCPQPDLTLGIQCHTDPGALAVLLQTHHGGLQCKHGDNWVDVKPVPGALVVNIGDLLQILSNDEYISVDHRALANTSREARVSAVVFFEAGDRDRLIGPFPELISPEKPARFQQLTFADYLNRFHSKQLDEKTLINSYRL